MATTNIWQQFKALIPEGVRVVASITANNGNGTSQATLRDGSVITVKGESVGIGEKAFVQNGEIKGAAPSLAQYEVEVYTHRLSRCYVVVSVRSPQSPTTCRFMGLRSLAA